MESMLPGTKKLDLGWFMNKYAAGVEASIDYKPTKNLSAFVTGDALYTYTTKNWDWQVLGGLRWKF
jgi:hypothetical protein